MSKSRNNALEFSSVGSIIVDADVPDATSGNFGAIQFLKDSAIEAAEANGIQNIEKLYTTFPAGTVLYGKFTSVTLSSGLAALHRV